MKILAVHQGSELYGSDRSFVSCVDLLIGKYGCENVDVWLPNEGPLVDRLQSLRINVLIAPQVKLTKSDAKFLLINKFTVAAFRLPSIISLFGKYDVVYINTIVILDVILAARFFSGKSLVHVREIPTGLARSIFSLVLRFSRANILFNSAATGRVFNLRRGQRSEVVLNGVAGYGKFLAPKFRSAKINALVIGRINTWKGQDVVLSAFEGMSQQDRGGFALRIVGGAGPGCDNLAIDIDNRCKALSKSMDVSYVNHTDDPSEWYSWADVVVVPSVKPEPFGLVAIEAMSAGCLVMAANHGGLTEIILGGENGVLVPPGDAAAIAHGLLAIVSDRVFHQTLAAAGATTFDKNFSVSALTRRFCAAFDKLIAEQD